MQKEWYVVNTYSGHENKVKEKLEMRASTMGMEDYIYRVVVPEENVVDEKGKEKKKKMFPGYILVEMVMSDEAWFIVRNTPGVTGFIGSSGKGAKPFPLTQSEVDKILGSMNMSRIDMENEYKAGNYVVCGGDFNMDLKNSDVDHDYSWGAPFPRNKLPKGLSLGMDVSKDSVIEHNSCRNANEPYNENTTFTITTDGFIVSDNIKVNYYNNANWKYEFSDHDPVIIQIILE